MTIEQVFEPTDDVRALVSELEADLAQHYPAEQRHGYAVEKIFTEGVPFFVAYLHGEAVGCGGIALGAEFGELKRMFVKPSFRGQGIAEGILARLAEEARGSGVTELRLETGTEQHAAIAFYRKMGFEVCEAFEPYRSMPRRAIATSVFMSKALVG